MPQFPDYDARRVRTYSAIGTGLLVLLALPTLRWTFQQIGYPVEHEWQRIVMSGVVGGAAWTLAQIIAKRFVRGNPTKSADYI